jgi:hypothetical protein
LNLAIGAVLIYSGKVSGSNISSIIFVFLWDFFNEPKVKLCCIKKAQGIGKRMENRAEEKEKSSLSINDNVKHEITKQLKS